jgi:hypothetical protein
MTARSQRDHEHEWVRSGDHDCRCACGADLWAIQEVLDAAADDAKRLAGDSFYTGCRVRQESESVELWLFNAPAPVLQELEAIRPGVYVIHNDAPRPLTTLDDLRDSFDWERWKTEGVKATSVGPTEDGYLHVGVENAVEAAQQKLDAAYGGNVVRVSQQGPFFALPARSDASRSEANT